LTLRSNLSGCVGRCHRTQHRLSRHHAAQHGRVRALRGFQPAWQPAVPYTTGRNRAAVVSSRPGLLRCMHSKCIFQQALTSTLTTYLDLGHIDKARRAADERASREGELGYGLQPACRPRDVTRFAHVNVSRPPSSLSVGQLRRRTLVKGASAVLYARAALEILADLRGTWRGSFTNARAMHDCLLNLQLRGH
jgi:hypothetical protein